MTFKGFIKKQSVAIWISLATFVLALVALIIYLVNGASAGYFYGDTNSTVVWFAILAIISSLASIVLSQFAFKGLLGKIVGLLIDALTVIVPVLLVAALLTFVGDRAEGLAYIFGSDANVLSEIQTPANLSSAYTAIIGFAFFAIAWLSGLVAAFFKFPKEAAAKAKATKA
jgi:hypothetical protein